MAQGTEGTIGAGGTTLAGFSEELAGIVERIAPSVVRVDDGTRLTATGVVWTADGVILTTSHGVERDEDLVVELANGTRLPATLVGRDDDTDIALLRVEASDLSAIPRAAPESAKVGSLALALARPGEHALQVTLGIISSRVDSQRGDQPEYILHTDATLYPGFSGGPLVNMRGEMIGLNDLLFGRGKGVALGISIATHIAGILLANGQVKRGYLGVRTQLVPLPESLRTALSIEQEGGLLIFQAEENGPAAKGGLLLGDILLALNGQTVQDVDQLRGVLRGLHAGQTIPVSVARGGERRELNITLGQEA